MAAEPGWDNAFDRFQPGAALIPEDAALGQALRDDGWVVTGRDDGYLLLEPSDR
jgi:hypothetical protein